MVEYRPTALTCIDTIMKICLISKYILIPHHHFNFTEVKKVASSASFMTRPWRLSPLVLAKVIVMQTEHGVERDEYDFWGCSSQ